MIVSPYIVACLAGWIVAQGSKYVIYAIKHKKNDIRQLYRSGSMPSAHSATVIALLTVIGLRDGVDSGLFGLALLMSAIIMYDAMMVRHSSGKQGEAIHLLIAEQNSKVPLPRIAKGHTPAEVAVGSALGALIGAIVFFAT